MAVHKKRKAVVASSTVKHENLKTTHIMATAKKKIERPYSKNRKAAAHALYELAKCYEPVKESVVYQKCYFSKTYQCWRYIGKAHDYSY